jgi:hypothetical protein
MFSAMPKKTTMMSDVYSGFECHLG